MLDATGSWRGAAQSVTATIVEVLGEPLLGVYVHGSAALGGWTVRSDLDVLVVMRPDASAPTRAQLEGLRADLLGSTAVPLELSIVGATAAARPRRPWPFVAHIAGTGEDRRLVVGSDHAGDTDLALHYWVTGSRGVTMLGPAPRALFGHVDRDDILAAMSADLGWALEHSDARYAILNGCRATAFACEGGVLSKQDGARWFLRHNTDTVERRIVDVAADAQRRGEDMGPARGVERALVERLRSGLR